MSDVLDDLCVCMHSRRYHDRNNERCHAGHCGCCKFVEFVEAQQAPEPARSEPPRAEPPTCPHTITVYEHGNTYCNACGKWLHAGSRPSAPAPSHEHEFECDTDEQQCTGKRREVYWMPLTSKDEQRRIAQRFREATDVQH